LAESNPYAYALSSPTNKNDPTGKIANPLKYSEYYIINEACGTDARYYYNVDFPDNYPGDKNHWKPQQIIPWSYIIGKPGLSTTEGYLMTHSELADAPSVDFTHYVEGNRIRKIDRNSVVYAIAKGVVKEVYAVSITICHVIDNKEIDVDYVHIRNIKVKKGKEVEEGAPIAMVADKPYTELHLTVDDWSWYPTRVFLDKLKVDYMFAKVALPARLRPEEGGPSYASKLAGRLVFEY